jgi:hypothetical protein
LPITNDEDLNKVLAISKANGSNKLSFLLTRKKEHIPSQIMPDDNQDDSGSVSDDGHTPDIDDPSLDSPPPGTIAPKKGRATISAPSKSVTSNNDGGFFIPESVCFVCLVFRKTLFVFRRRMIRIPVVVHRLPVENQARMNIAQDDGYLVKFSYFHFLN